MVNQDYFHNVINVISLVLTMSFQTYRFEISAGQRQRPELLPSIFPESLAEGRTMEPDQVLQPPAEPVCAVAGMMVYLLSVESDQ